ncbi:MAG: class B sortase [Erysipelotrichaceae bacterium]|nr:class B sortase [Erysipelotrichaceae bacterium]
MIREKNTQETYAPRHLKKETVMVEETGKQSGINRPLCILLMILGITVAWLHIDRRPVKTNLTETAKKADPMPSEYRDIWIENKAINSDYAGQIIFDSGLIDLPFVQAKDVYDENGNAYVFYTAEGETVADIEEYTGNDVYIWKNWKTGAYDRYGEGGSVFMDYRNSLDDRNLIIYGHHFARDYDPSGSKQFTPLDLLLKKENYDRNSSLKLVLDNEIRTYEVRVVLIIDAREEEQLEIVSTDVNHDMESFKDYAALIEKLSVYDTGKRIREKDSLLTLITCVEHRPELRQAVICSEISRKVYTD